MKEIFLTSRSLCSPSGWHPEPGSTPEENLSSDILQGCCLAVESWLLPMRDTKVEHSRYVLQAQKILQLIIEMITTPDFAREHSDDTSSVCARHATTNLMRRNDATFRIEVIDIHRLPRLDHHPLQAVGGTQEFSHNCNELSNEDVQHHTEDTSQGSPPACRER